MSYEVHQFELWTCLTFVKKEANEVNFIYLIFHQGKSSKNLFLAWILIIFNLCFFILKISVLFWIQVKFLNLVCVFNRILDRFFLIRWLFSIINHLKQFLNQKLCKVTKFNGQRISVLPNFTVWWESMMKYFSSHNFETKYFKTCLSDIFLLFITRNTF